MGRDGRLLAVGDAGLQRTVLAVLFLAFGVLVVVGLIVGAILRAIF
jgi:hypothetical protein